MEERQFSKLHYIVLGLVPGCLEGELAKTGTNVNATDHMGRTALSWAIWRQDHISTELLLRHGADPNIAGLSGETPAAFAANRNNLIGLKLLLEAGASIAQKGRLGKNWLHYAAISALSCGLLEVLIAAGCDIKEKDSYGSTPLNIAAQYSVSATINALIRYGSDINTTDLDGDCPLSAALFERRDENVQVLLNHGASYMIINNYGYTTLHCVALSGGLETLEILRSAKLTRIDPNAKDKKGRTALQLAKERCTKPEGFINLFLTLLFEIRCRNDALARDGGQAQGGESVEAHGLSGGERNRSGERSSAVDGAEGSRGAEATQIGRDSGKNDGGSGEAFFDALEQQ